MLTCNSLLPLLYIELLSLTIYSLELICLRIYSLALHLSADNRSLQGNNTKVMTIRSLDNHKISGLDALTGCVAVYSLAGVLEAHFEELIELFLINALKPIIHLKLAAALTIVALNFASLRTLYCTASRAVILF